MLATYRPILSLLRGTAFLLAASGLHGLLLPLRGQLEGFSTPALGLMGTAWAGGFVAGCFFAFAGIGFPIARSISACLSEA